MIAYNHLIDFIENKENKKNTLNSSYQTITIQNSPFNDYKKHMNYQMKFSNNQGREIVLYSQGDFSRTRDGQQWAFEVKDVVSFFWKSGTKTLTYIPHKNFTKQLLEYWCLHIVLPLYFTVEEIYDFLHAGAVQIEGKPILLIAESFGGKSTLTDFFLKREHKLISDDKVATYEDGGNFFSVPSIPFHRPYRKMEDLGHYINNLDTTPKPIHAIYELVKSEADTPISIKELHGIEKFKSLRYNSEINLSFLKSKRFIFLSRLAKVIPVYKVTVPWDLNRLGDVYQKICDHSKGIS